MPLPEGFRWSFALWTCTCQCRLHGYESQSSSIPAFWRTVWSSAFNFWGWISIAVKLVLIRIAMEYFILSYLLPSPLQMRLSPSFIRSVISPYMFFWGSRYIWNCVWDLQNLQLLFWFTTVWPIHAPLRVPWFCFLRGKNLNFKFKAKMLTLMQRCVELRMQISNLNESELN